MDKKTKGLTLTELVIAAVIGGILLVAVGSFTVTTMQKHTDNREAFLQTTEERVARDHLDMRIKECLYVEIGDEGDKLDLYNGKEEKTGTYYVTEEGLVWDEDSDETVDELFENVFVTFTENAVEGGKTTGVNISYSEAFGADQVVTARLDLPIIWAKRFIGGASAIGKTREVNDGFIMRTAVLHGAFDRDSAVVKVNKYGEYEWSSAYYDPTQWWGNFLLSIIPASDGYLLLGAKDAHDFGSHDGFFIKIDFEGKVKWSGVVPSSPALNRDGQMFSSGLEVMTESGEPDGYILCAKSITYGVSGDSQSIDGFDIYVLRIDNEGNKIWSKTFGMDIPGADPTSRWLGVHGWHIAEVSGEEDGYIISGFVYDFGPNPEKPNVYVLRINKNGNYEWSKTFGSDDSDSAYYAYQTPVGGHLIEARGGAGLCGSARGGLYLIEIDGEDGTHRTSKVYGNIVDSYHQRAPTFNDEGKQDGAIELIATDAGEDLIDMVLRKLRDNGSTEWERLILDNVNSHNRKYAPNGVYQTSDGGYILRIGDNVVVKTDRFGNCPDPTDPVEVTFTIVKRRANPIVHGAPDEEIDTFTESPVTYHDNSDH